MQTMAPTGDVASKNLNDQVSELNHRLGTSLELHDAATEMVCDSGDVIFVANDGINHPMKIRVSSVPLSLASKVFKALFSSRFAEGQIMRKAGGSPIEISLDDDPTDLLLLCQLLHFQGDIESTTDQQFLGLAIVIDKYDCVKALKYAINRRFAMVELCDGAEIESLIYHATTACILDDPIFFRVFTKSLVLDYETAFPKLSGRLDRLPSEVLPSILAQRTFAHQELTHHLGNFIQKYHTAASALGASAHSKELNELLQGLDLWPLDPNFLSLRWALAELRETHFPIMQADVLDWGELKFNFDSDSDDDDENDNENDDENASPEINRDSPTRSQLSPENDELLQQPEPAVRSVKSVKPPTTWEQTLLIERIELFCVGVCLDCSKGRDKCRVPHKDPFDPKKWTAVAEMGRTGKSEIDPITKRAKDWDSAW